jgi:hypothetical protein
LPRNRIPLLVISLMLAATVGCRRDPLTNANIGRLALGKSREEDVRKLFGDPDGTDEVVQGSKSSKILTYFIPESQNVGPYYSIIYSSLNVETHNGTLAGYVYCRNYGPDATSFNVKKTDLIIEGKTTRQEAIALLGPPMGVALPDCRLPDFRVVRTNTNPELLAWTNAEPVVAWFPPFSKLVLRLKVFTVQIGPDQRVISKTVADTNVSDSGTTLKSVTN